MNREGLETRGVEILREGVESRVSHLNASCACGDGIKFGR